MMAESDRFSLRSLRRFGPSREDVWCLILTFLFIAPPLLLFVRQPRLIFLLFAGILGATGFNPLRQMHRTSDARYVYAYLAFLYLTLSPGLWTIAGPAAGIRHYIFYYSLTLVLISLLSLSGRYAWLVKVPVMAVSAFSVAVGLVFLVYAATTGSLLGEETLNSVYQTDLREARGYIETFIGFPKVVLAVVVLATAVFLLWGLGRSPTRRIARVEYQALLAVTVLLAWETRDSSNEYLVASTALQYRASIQRYRRVATERHTSVTEIDARYTRTKPETVVIVIGESTNRNHMGIYGYFRNTTPTLGRLASNLVVLTDAISSDRLTEPVLEKALSFAEADNRPRPGDSSAHSLIEVLRAAGVRVYWLSNQNRLGLWDNHTALISEGADRRVFVSGFIGEKTASRPDEALFPAMKTALSQPGEAKVIFVHLMGTHFPYWRRYPKKFAQYHDSNFSAEVGASEVNQKVTKRTDEYDDAVLYNDYVVSTLIGELKHAEGGSALLYFADHGETPLGRTRDQLFSPGQVEIPMFFWFSDEFRAKHSALIEVLAGNRRKRFMNDQLFDMVLDLVGVESHTHSPQRSLFRREFVERSRRTLSGRLDYDRYPDPIIMARNNMGELRARFPGLVQKIYPWSGPNRSSLGQAIQLFPGVAFDLTFNEERGTFDLAQSAPGVGMTLADALEFLRSNESDAKLLLRLGNLREDNAASAAAALVKLDEEYQFRRRATLVAPNAGETLRSLVQLGLTATFLEVKRPLILAHADSAASGRHLAIMAVSSGDGFRVRPNPQSPANELRSLDATVVEADVEPSDVAFVESMSRLSEADAARTVAIVVRALSKFDEHF